MPVNYKKIENKERYITVKFQTQKPWAVIEQEIDSFLIKLTENEAISEVHEFNSLAEQLKDKDAIKPTIAAIVTKPEK